MTKKIMVSTLLAGLMLSTSAYANNVSAKDAQQLKTIVNTEVSAHRQALTQAPKEITDGLQQTVVALRALQQNQPDSAKKALTEATKLFDEALKNNPKLTLVPVADEVEVNDFTGDAKLVKHVIKSVEEMLEANDTQAARETLMTLQDEIDMQTRYLPMGIYPLATKDALKALNKGDTKGAFTTLATALNGVVTQVVIIPIPLLTAADFVDQASKLDKSNKKDATKLLDQAQDELEKAVLLGYTQKHASEYENLKKEIGNIQKEIEGKNMVEKLYDNIKNDFKALVSKHKKSAGK